MGYTDAASFRLMYQLLEVKGVALNKFHGTCHMSSTALDDCQQSPTHQLDSLGMEIRSDRSSRLVVFSGLLQPQRFGDGSELVKVVLSFAGRVVSDMAPCGAKAPGYLG